jgi:hypothetical protein
MNDFDYDAMQKKRIARGAYARKGGARSKKCTLPGDYLTAAEKRKLSTTKVSVNLKKPMTWKEFKALPTDVKIEYLSYLRDELGARRSWVAKDLFCISTAAFQKHIELHEPKLKGIFPKSGRYTADRRVRWLDWVHGVEQEIPPDASSADEDMLDYCGQDVKATQELEPIELSPQLRPKHLAATYTGELYADDLNAIFYRLLKDRPCKSITIDITF